MPTLAEKVRVYVDKLILQYRLQPRARATVGLFVQELIGEDLASQVQAAFGIDTAVGAQLDILGKYIGVSRNVGIPRPEGFFGFWNTASVRDPTKYQGVWEPATNTPALPAPAGGNNGWWYAVQNPGMSTTPIAAAFLTGDVIFSNGAAWAKSSVDNANGFNATGDSAVNANALWYRTSFSGGLSTDLTDAQYRTVLKLKAILNTDPATLDSIMRALYQFFPGTISLVDGADMTLSYFVNSSVPLDAQLLARFLPKPMGVGINVSIINPAPGTGSPLTTEDGFTLTTEDGTGIITTEGS